MNMDTRVLLEKKNNIAFITLNNQKKHNAFDDVIIKQLSLHFKALATCQTTRVIVLKANGKHFCAGADLNWMKRMKAYSMEDNQKDSLALAQLLSLIYHHPKTVIAAAQGYAFGGGVGLIAACDFAIATKTAVFCFSEVKLGLIPAVISPFVINAIGAKRTKKLFLTGEQFTAEQALDYQLVQTVCEPEKLDNITLIEATRVANNAPKALLACKTLVNHLTPLTIDEPVLTHTANLIATLRVSPEGQEGLTAFFDKRQPKWN